jgi:hypothetical protein
LIQQEEAKRREQEELLRRQEEQNRIAREAEAARVANEKAKIQQLFQEMHPCKIS